MVEVLKEHGANRISEVKPDERLTVMLKFIRMKMQTKHDYWERTS